MSVSAVEPKRVAPTWFVRALWVALTIALAIAVRNLAWTDIVAHLARVQAGWLAVAMAANFVILPLWAAEWRLLLPSAFRVSYHAMFAIVAITASVLNSVPFLAGEASAVGLLVGRGRLSRSAALTVLALDQLLVAFGKLIVIGAAVLFVPLPPWLRAGLLSLAGAFATLLAVLLVLAHRWRALQEGVARRSGRAAALIARVIAWGRHLDALRDVKRAAPAIALAVLKKAAEVAAVLATQLAFGLAPSLSAALLVVACLAITTLLPIAPANLGVYEATVFAAYRYLGVPADVAVGLALLQHVCFLAPAILTGYGIATFGRRSPEAPAP